MILATAGAAVGLGNLLRFPVQASQHGGGAFMIPYFFFLFIMGIPMMWVEWTIGRMGGKYGHGTAPGIFNLLWSHPLSRYLGVLGLVTPLILCMYYLYVCSWTLAFSFFSLGKLYYGLNDLESMKDFLQSFQGVKKGYFQSILPAYLFFLVAFFANFFIMYHGLAKGIERLCKLAMPTLFLVAILLIIRSLTLGTPDPNHPERSALNGLGFLWNPNFSELKNADTWLAAAGQIFFTLSLGLGTIHCYASYLREKDDIVLSGLTVTSLNETAEVILGGSIAIPAAVAFFGIEQIAQGGAFDLGFLSMPLVLSRLPFGEFWGFLWFILLFFAGLTSSVSIIQPFVSFLIDELKLPWKRAVIFTAIAVFIPTHLVIFFLKYGFLDELDFWIGTVGMPLFGLIELILFAWIYGIDKGFKEMHRGALLTVPKIYCFILKYITPTCLFIIFCVWIWQSGLKLFLLKGIPERDIPYRLMARGLILISFLICVFLVHFAWKGKKNEA
ncbi:MAG: sodium-dependent transporter [Candidatus Desulfofervidus auxilii]|nr:sodium-dependent transporter [Candidatus Desulfofervidus auxilii]